MWLSKAIEAIAAGDLPQSNPNDAVPLRFRFDFSWQGHVYTVEFIDYSGELLDPAKSDAEIAIDLRRRMGQYDGILVLAEAPRPGEPGKLAVELSRLQQAFALLRQYKDYRLSSRTVIALLLNKWDRRAVNGQPQNVDEFLSSPEGIMHRHLRDAIVTENPDSFQAFALSAFGRTVGEPGQERPESTNPIPSFGLEEPFIWAARRSQQVSAEEDERHIRTVVDSFAWWKIGQLMNDRTQKLRKAIREFRTTYPAHFPHHPRVEIESRRHFTIQAWQIGFVAVGLFFGWCVATLISDGVRYCRHREVLLHPESASIEQLESVEHWLIDHADRHGLWSPMSRLILSNREAGEQVSLVRTQMVTTRQKIEHTAADREMLAAWEKSLADVQNHDELIALAARSVRLPNSSDDAELNQAFARYQSSLLEKRTRMERDLGFEKSESDFYRAFERNDFAECAKIILSDQIQPDTRVKLKTHFRKHIYSQVHEDSDRLKRAGRWTDASNKLEDISRSANIANLLLETDLLTDIRKLKSALVVEHDEMLYNLFRDKRTVDVGRNYLTQSLHPTKPMARYVRDHISYLDELKEDKIYTFVVEIEKIEWKSPWEKAENVVIVWIDDSPSPVLSHPGVVSMKNSTTDREQIGAKFEVKARLSGTITIHTDIRVTSDNTFLFSTRKHGEGNVSVKVDQLVRNGATCLLAKDEKDDRRHKVYFKVVSGSHPKEVELPPYKK